MKFLYFWRNRKIAIRRPKNTSITLAEWRQNPELIRQARDLWNSPFGGLLLDMLHNESPLNKPFPDIGTKSDDRIYHLARIQSYHRAISYLVSTAVPEEQTTQELTATFAPPQ